MTTDPLGDGISSLELLDKMGNDLTIVNAARVSYAKRSEILAVKDSKLIAYLLKNDHGSPFEHVVFQFRVRAPLVVVAQWERHRMASYNEESGRYIELRDDFYIPRDGEEQFNDVYETNRANAWGDYQELLSRGETKERARMVLGTNLYKEFWWTVNARSLMNFLRLRNDDHAQWEIRRYAQELEKLFEQVLPNTYDSFISYGRKAP